jgi:hypothetical protein
LHPRHEFHLVEKTLPSANSAATNSITSVMVWGGGGKHDDCYSPVCAASQLIWGGGYPKKVVGNILFLNFVFHTFSLKYFSEEIGAPSGLDCATPRTTSELCPPAGPWWWAALAGIKNTTWELCFPARFSSRRSPLSNELRAGHRFFNVNYEDDFNIEKKYYAAISRTLHLSHIKPSRGLPISRDYLFKWGMETKMASLWLMPPSMALTVCRCRSGYAL